MHRRKPRKDEGGGAPEWMTTYGDMMTLLLCFFVLIVSFSEIKKEDQFQAVVEEIQKAFGMEGGGGRLPTDEDPALSMLNILETLRQSRDETPNESQAEDQGMDGESRSVKTIRRGMLFRVGGQIEFEPGSSELTDRAKANLRDLVPQLEGLNNLIQLRGHAAALETDGQGKAVDDLYALSFARARAVGKFLRSPPMDIDPNRLRYLATGAAEPVKSRSYTRREQAANRRVEIIQVEAVEKDFTQPRESTDEPLMQP